MWDPVRTQLVSSAYPVDITRYVVDISTSIHWICCFISNGYPAANPLHLHWIFRSIRGWISTRYKMDIHRIDCYCSAYPKNVKMDIHIICAGYLLDINWVSIGYYHQIQWISTGFGCLQHGGRSPAARQLLNGRAAVDQWPCGRWSTAARRVIHHIHWISCQISIGYIGGYVVDMWSTMRWISWFICIGYPHQNHLYILDPMLVDILWMCAGVSIGARLQISTAVSN